MALLGLEVELHPEPLARIIPQGERVRAVAVHVHRRLRQAAIAHQDRHLMQGLGAQGPEVPHRRRRAQIGLRVALLRVDEVGELVGIAHEEDGRVVAHHVPVALLRIELEREAPHVALVVGGARFARHGREARDHRRFGARLQHLGLGVARNVARNPQRAVRAPTLGVDGALGNALTVLVRQLLDQLVVLQQERPALARRQRVLIVGHRGTRRGGQDRLLVVVALVGVAHSCFPSRDRSGNARAWEPNPSIHE